MGLRGYFVSVHSEIYVITTMTISFYLVNETNIAVIDSSDAGETTEVW